MIARLEDIAEESGTFFWGYAIVGVCTAVKPPASSITPFPF
jgi:hypothetical protein